MKRVTVGNIIMLIFVTLTSGFMVYLAWLEIAKTYNF